ncbi:ABC transporter permease subunit [Burkholderia orbicola]|uniref:ABC transporter permease subunit n=9 Tax=Burkholderia TaxID=32008 RepID=A0A427NMT9_9BURK|nr:MULTISPECIES: ABC transporter permease subunit [Burkholderia]EKS9843936.1 ABC transporter permease subunit [Burkholderia cepacia]BEV49810.1 ABC transporter permease subunit [Burkholderia contaminans]ABK11491.1 binding-protein-dependent transport systems inner membrane component [Burkholderia cenocepacia HI2424]ACA94653.1 binding-protein-dependent transport systems inner membrane component [Burkholderia orbicola MC0-3]AQT53162.1 sulfonate ABC transporter permease [Burkholderia cenocepacia]
MDISFFDPNRTANASAWRVLPNRWDAIAFPLIIGILAMAIVGFHQTMAPIGVLQTQKISLDPSNLPEYALRTTLRMLAAMIASLVFTLVYGTLAAKSRRAGMVLIPILDILQSVPVLGYISFTVTFFLALFPGRVLGAELAAIFAIFTSQAWNMTFSFYQSLRTVPRDLSEVSRGFHLTPWQRFWKLEVPFSMPGLIWNMMMSMSGGWFFVVASEAITVGNQTITLPGIGAYLAQAISDKNLGAVGWVIVAMSVVILAYDQFLFRPLVAWADKFRMENTASGDAPQSWLLDMMRRTHLIHQLLVPAGWLLSQAARIPLRVPSVTGTRVREASARRSSRIGDIVWGAFVILLTVYVAWRVVSFVATGVTVAEVGHVLVLGLITLLRVLVLIAIASVIWVPLGVLIGLRPKLAEKIQPLAQFLAAFPANLLFPVFVIVIVHFHLNADIWLSPLIVLGTQWYILFNVIAGAMSYPNDYKEATKNFRIRGWQWWRQAILPGIFPYYVTGAITASGGAWNASIVSEFVQWGDTKVVAHGLGAYIAQTTAAGDFPKIILGIAVMSLFVTLFNRLLWRPMYAYAESRLRLD